MTWGRELEDKKMGTRRKGWEIGEKTWELKAKRVRTGREEDGRGGRK